MNSTKQTATLPSLTLIPPPPPKFLLRPPCPPPRNHWLAPDLRPRYLEIVNRQLAIDIKKAEWERELQNLLFSDQTEVDLTRKQVRWAEEVRFYEADYWGNDEEDSLYEEDYYADHEGQQHLPSKDSNLKTPQATSGCTVPEQAEEEFSLPFPSRSAPAEDEENFSPPFPSLAVSGNHMGKR
jgi:hypothetical protein